MAHSIELLFDDATDAAVRAVWDALAAAGLPSQGRVTAPTNRPHVTLTVADVIDPAVDALLAPLADRLPLPCVLGAPLVFGGGRLTLARLVVPSAELLGLHAEVHRRSLPHLRPGAAAHSAPGRWTPHATLCRRITAAELGEAFRVVGAITGDIDARAVGLRRWDGTRRVEHHLVS